MEQLRDSMGLIDLTDIIEDKKQEYFIYNDKKYFFKFNRCVGDIYNELIAEEIAIDYGISCAHYDIGSYENFLLVFSENVINNGEELIDVNDMLSKYYPNEINVDKHNNLEDLWEVFLYNFKDCKIVETLMKQMVDLFIFDILIGNMDRHVLNYFLIKKDDDIFLAPIIDNENMLNETSIYHGGYDLGVTYGDYFYCSNELKYEDNFLLKFLSYSTSDYAEYFINKYNIICEENIELIFKRVEKRINSEMNENIKDSIRKRFEQNRYMINNILEEYKRRQKKKVIEGVRCVK